MKTKVLTLCMIVRHPEILLAMKKRGFGAGRWNGFGGKVEPGETVEEAAKREVKEESGIEVTAMEKRGEIRFTFDGSDEIKEVHIFAVTTYAGEPSESEEMKPQWFNLLKIPFTDMWQSDTYWIPLFLKGSKFRGAVHLNEKHQVVHHEVKEIANQEH